MRQETSRLKLSYGWLRGEDYWGDPVSANFVKLDMLLNPVVISMTEVKPPQAGIKVGDMYIVAAGATDTWETHDGQLAVLTINGWVYLTPTEGVRARLRNPTGWIWFNGTVWIPEDQDTDVAPVVQGAKYDIALSIGYEAEPDEVLLAFAVPEAMTLPNGAPESAGRALVPPVKIMRLSIRRNGVEVGTILFALNSVKANYNVTGDKVFAAGDLLTIHMPESPPSGFENYGVTLRLILQRKKGE